MKISILTLFPEMFAGPFAHSIVKNAQEKELAKITLVNIRNSGLGKHKIVDDKPYGGGVGMVMKVDVLVDAIEKTRDTTIAEEKQKVILLDARGETFSQKKAQVFSMLEHLILVCGHYEGVDERVRNFVDETISIGDFVVTGGEIPAMLIADSVIRLLPHVIREGATANESFSLGNHQNETLLEYPQYTTPSVFRNLSVPEVLLSGNHQKIASWKKEQSTMLTRKHRPDLLLRRGSRLP